MSGRDLGSTDSVEAGSTDTAGPASDGSDGNVNPAPATEAPRKPPQPAPEHAPPRERRLPYPLVLILLAAAVLVPMVAGLVVGSVSLPPADVAGILVHSLVPGLVEPGWPPTYATIVLDVRLPRVLLGGVVGAGLAVVGTALQALVRNPLADPFLLGVSSGASLGAVAALLSGMMFLGGAVTPMVAAFAGSLVALVFVYTLARSGGRMTTTRLILAGVAVSYVLGALTNLLIVTADNPHVVMSVLHWTLGSLGGAQWDTLPIPTVVVGAGLVVALFQARSLNLLFAGEEAAGTLGLNVHRFRAGMFVLVSLMTGVMVAVSGSIGFVGLMVPHAVRMLVGADHQRVLPASALLGAAFLITADIAARTVAAPQEIQIGVLTALCGGPFFVWLLRRQARKERAGR